MENTAVAGASVLARRNFVTMKQIAMMHQTKSRRTAVSVGLSVVFGKLRKSLKAALAEWSARWTHSSGPGFEFCSDHSR